MRKRTKILTAAVAAIVLGAGIAGVGIAQADIQTPAPGHTTVLGAGVRIVANPGQAIAAGQTQVVKVGGQTFQGQAIPADATGVILSVANNQSSGAGQLRVFTTGAGQPGNPTVEWAAGKVQTQSVTVGLDTAGQISVNSTVATRYLVSIIGFTTPECSAKTFTVAPASKLLTKVGGSIKTGKTDFGSVTVPAGTYDVRITGGFRGLNASNNTVPAGVPVSGTMVMTRGADIAADFSDPTAATLIPDAPSATLTQDPTLDINRFVTFAASTEVHVQFFAYAGDSSTAGSGEIEARLQNAQLRRVCN